MVIKVKWFTKEVEEKPKVSIKVEGTLEIKDPDLADFESYKRKVRKEQLKKEIERYVYQLLPDKACFGDSPREVFDRGFWFRKARELLVEKIMEQIEID